MLFALDIIRILFAGFVFQTLWLWFIVPLGFLSLTFPHALGVFLFLRFAAFQWNGPTLRKDTLKDKLFRISISAFVLALGYLYSLFI